MSKVDKHEVLELTHNGANIKRRVGECISVVLPIADHNGCWRAEPVADEAVKRSRSIVNLESGNWRYTGVYKMMSPGTATIQILYRRAGVIEQVFKLKVQVVPQPVPPPIKSVYLVEEITSRQVGDSRENEYETSKERLGIACSQEGVEDLIVRKRPGVVVQWRQDGSSARVEIQRLSRDSNREVYIQVTREPLHW